MVRFQGSVRGQESSLDPSPDPVWGERATAELVGLLVIVETRTCVVSYQFELIIDIYDRLYVVFFAMHGNRQQPRNHPGPLPRLEAYSGRVKHKSLDRDLASRVRILSIIALDSGLPKNVSRHVSRREADSARS